MWNNGIGLHIVYEEGIDERVLRERLSMLQPRYINVFGAARIDQAFAFAASMVSQTNVIFRRWSADLPDDGLHKKITVDQYMRLYQPFLAKGLICLTDNESGEEDMSGYANWQADIMEACNANNWRVAVGRTSTGNPGGYGDEHLLEPINPRYRPDQYTQMKRMFEVLARSGGKHIYSPNEYVARTGFSAGMTARFVEAFKRTDAWGIARPPVVIGEYGTAYIDANGWLDAEAGYRDSRNNLTGRQYARLIIDSWKQYYKQHGADVCVYCYGDSVGHKWERFNVANDADFWDELLRSAQSGELIALPQTRPVEVVTAGSFKPRIGYNITAVNDKQRLIEHLKKIDPPALLAYESEFAYTLAREFPKATVILRSLPDDNIHKSMTPAQWIEKHQSVARSNIYLYTTNEPAWGKDLIDWHIELVKLALDKGIRLCIMNLSVGIPDRGQWAEAEELIRLISKNRSSIILGLHEYAGGVVTSGMSGGNPWLISKKLWPNGYKAVQTDMYHIGRWHFLRRFCEEKSITLPRIIVTEHGFDGTGDIATWLNTLKVDGGSANGWRSLIPQWREWWPEWSPEQAYMEQLMYVQKHIYPGIEAALLFAFEEGKSDWPMYNVNHPGLLKQMENLAKAQPMPPVLTPGHQYRISTPVKNGEVYLRREPVIDQGNMIGMVKDNSIILVRREALVSRPGSAVEEWWVEVTHDGKTGWVSRQWSETKKIYAVGFQYIHVEPPTQPPVTPPSPPPTPPPVVPPKTVSITIPLSANVSLQQAQAIVESLKLLGLNAVIT